MMGGVSSETCWTIKKHWNNTFYYSVASCWFFLWDLYYGARIHERLVQYLVRAINSSAPVPSRTVSYDGSTNDGYITEITDERQELIKLPLEAIHCCTGSQFRSRRTIVGLQVIWPELLLHHNRAVVPLRSKTNPSSSYKLLKETPHTVCGRSAAY
jgi:hypothetical protein